MVLEIPGVLDAAALAEFRRVLAAPTAPWVDGRATAGRQGAAVKQNLQLAEDSELARALGDAMLGALERNALFVSGSLPHRVYPPMFNRYEGGMAFGDHIDNAVRMLRGGAEKLRTDLSATLFLSDPGEYDGGELLVREAGGVRAFKLAAGSLVLYPASSVHRVAPVTRGTRLACFFWVQSMVRDDGRRALLFDLDQALQKFTATGADESARVALAGCYHNLLRQWIDV